MERVSIARDAHVDVSISLCGWVMGNSGFAVCLGRGAEKIKFQRGEAFLLFIFLSKRSKTTEPS